MVHFGKLHSLELCGTKGREKGDCVDKQALGLRNAMPPTQGLVAATATLSHGPRSGLV